MSEDLAWAAGLFDGEGTFQIARDGRSESKYYARMRLGMCHRGAVEKFLSVMNVGAIIRENTPAKNSNYVQYRWSTSGQRAINCAALLYPYLVVKKHEAEILLRFEPTIANGRNKFLSSEMVDTRKQLYEEMLVARGAHLQKVIR